MSHILVQRDGAILTLTFNRPEKKNSLNDEMYAVLTRQLQQAADDPAIRVAIIQGTPELFTAGNDLADFMKGNRITDSGSAARLPALDFLDVLVRFPKPLIAAVCGPAVGIGTTLILHCDLIYAGSNASFSLPFVNLGLCPEAGSSRLLPALMGYPRAAEKLMLGEAFDAQEALQLKLINRVLAPEEVSNFAYAQALKLTAKPLQSLMITKALMKRSQQHIEQTMQEELRHFGDLLAGPAVREAISAFQQKRPADFSGC